MEKELFVLLKFDTPQQSTEWHVWSAQSMLQGVDIIVWLVLIPCLCLNVIG